MNPPRIVLASTSRYRRELLERIGIDALAQPHRCDEEAVKATGLRGRELVSLLAQRKAESLAAEYPEAVIIGSDQVAELDGQLLGKPRTADRAVEQLSQLNGRSHRLLTAVALVAPTLDAPRVVIDEHVLTMRRWSRHELVEYVRRDQPLDCAGSYRIESLGIALFERIEGNDFTAIIGLPLTTVVGLLRSVGVAVFGDG